ncbi:HNH endonuclease [Iningainema tapete]|uniref:HNH endonuclease n=1 Tax=Iningainema tapete BLCC-T55 TaxID=2748662 RepID=A0A8J6XUP0_9CYAN|nr:HNH endonuclease signature motif containing protein [Iningainema tapete]MBD2778660.1 HNH endonuclease [Iningainema tapete BLCC-T55]
MNIIFNPEKHFLGNLCRHNHNWENTGKSLRIRIKSGSNRCAVCADLHNRRNKGNKEHSKKQYAAYGKPWYEKNRERLREDRKVYREQTKEKTKERGKRYREENHEAILESAKDYYYRNKIKFFIKANNRRIRKASCHAYPYQKTEALARFENSCAYCGCKEKLTIDHFIPITKGGPDCLGNIVPACIRCNTSKLNHDPLQWYKSQPFYSKQRWQKILKELGKTDANYTQLPLF